MVLWPNGVTSLPDDMEVRLEFITKFEKHFLELEPFPLPPPTSDPEEIKRVLTAMFEVAFVSDWQCEHNHVFMWMMGGQNGPIWPLIFSVFNPNIPVHFSSIMPALREAATAAHPQWGDREGEDNLTYALLSAARGYFERKLSYL
jgi:hypothetical protein